MGNGKSSDEVPPKIPSPDNDGKNKKKKGMFAMMGDGYEQLINAIIRPPRAEYDPRDMGPKRFQISGFKFQRVDITLKNDRGMTLQCSWWKPEKKKADTLPCVVCLHGNASCRLVAMDNLNALLTTGITVFAFDFAGSGLSDGKYVSLGYHEQEDLKVVIAHLRASTEVSTIGLWGRSMGAATALLYAHRDPSIAGMVLDSSFADMYQLCREMVRFAEKQGWYVPGVLMASAIRMLRNSVLKRVPGFDIYDLKPIANVDKAFIPALFVHGKEDDFILPSHSEKLHKKYAGEANIMLVEGDHNSRRPRYARDSAAIFLKTALRVPDSYAIPVHGMRRESFQEVEHDEFEEDREMARHEQALIERAIQMSLREEEVSSKEDDALKSSAVVDSEKNEQEDQKMLVSSPVENSESTSSASESLPIPKPKNSRG